MSDLNNNAKPAYEYTKASIDRAGKYLSKVSANLKILFIANFFSIGFLAIVSPASSFSFVLLTVFAFIAMVTSLVGINVNSPINVIHPDSFLDPEIYRLSEEEFYLFLLRQQIKTLNQLDAFARRKEKYLNASIAFSSLAVVTLFWINFM